MGSVDATIGRVARRRKRIAKQVSTGFLFHDRSALPICYDAALKLCRDRDYRIVSQQPSASLSAHARSFDFTLTFARATDNRTRVTMRATSPEASRFLDQLCDTLLEPRQ